MNLSQAWHDLAAAVGVFVSRPATKPFNGSVVAVPGANTMATDQPFVAEASYFSVRLVEMNLAEGGRFFVDFLPLGVCLSEYTYGSERQRRPLILNNDAIAGQLKAAGAKPGFVEYRNMYAVRLAPVKADNLSLFVGLFRMPYNDLAKQMLQLAADVTDQITVAAPGVSQGVRVAEKIYDRIAGLFKLSDLTPLLGFADGNALTNSGYFVVAGPDDVGLSRETLRVKEGRLHRTGAQGLQPASGFDYCLVAIEHTPTLVPFGDKTINPLVDLPFHKGWRAIAQLLINKKLPEAEASMPQLRAEVVSSSDLTEDDRLVVVSAYDTAFEKYRGKFVQVDAPRGESRAAGEERAINSRADEAASRARVGQVTVSRALNSIVSRLNKPMGALPDLENRPDEVFLQEAEFLRNALVTKEGTSAEGASAGTAARLADALPRAAI